MTKTIQDIILKWIGEDKPTITDEMITNTPFGNQIQEQYKGYNKVLADLREKVPSVVEEIQRAIWTDMLEKTEGWYGRSESMINDYFKNQLTQE